MSKAGLSYIILQVGRYVIVNHLYFTSLDKDIHVPNSIGTVLVTNFQYELLTTIRLDIKAVGSVMVNSEENFLGLSVI